MGRAALCMRAAALLAAAGMFIFLAEGISADNEIAEAVTARVLKPTQAIAEVPEEYNELFEIQWGGGSLYHLKARLATMGCILNTIWAYDDNKWYAYNQYDIPHATYVVHNNNDFHKYNQYGIIPHSLNQPFLTHFKDDIPATTLYGTCIEICSFDIDAGSFLKAGKCKSWEQAVQPIWIQQKAELQATGNPIIDDNASCNDDFHPLVKEKVFPLLPLMPDTCVVRQPQPKEPTYYGGAAYAGYIVLWLRAEPYSTHPIAKEIHHIQGLHIEIHELCHMQQQYHSVQQAPLNQTMHHELVVYRTDAIKEFMKVIGMTENPGWNFQLPDNSIYKQLYGINPIEISAELCTLYLLDKMEEKSNYYIFNETFDPRKYLTLQVVEWLETYMVLPYPNYDNE